MDGSARGISFEDTYEFAAAPQEMWQALGRTDLYPSWWKWMRDVHVEGRVPESRSVVAFRIFAPIPYRMRLSVEVTEADQPHRIEARIAGDLSGRGRLVFEPSGGGTTVQVGWDVEVANQTLRSLIRVSRPLLIRAQHWAVGVALRGFRRYLTETPLG